MSIRIRNGYRVRLSEGADVFSVASQMRELLTPVVQRNLLEDTISAAVNYYDIQCLAAAKVIDAKPGPKNAWINVHAKKEAKEGLGDNQVTITFHVDPADRDYIYIMLFGNPERIDDLNTLLETLGIHEYGYWNNSDCPDGMTKKQWVERKNTWERIGVLDSTPAEVGLSLNLLHSRYRYTILSDNEQVFNRPTAQSLIPDFETRVHQMAVDIHFSHTHAGGHREWSHDTFSQFMDSSRAIEEGTSEAAVTALETARQNLVENLTLEMLWKKFPSPIEDSEQSDADSD